MEKHLRSGAKRRLGFMTSECEPLDGDFLDDQDNFVSSWIKRLLENSKSCKNYLKIEQLNVQKFREGRIQLTRKGYSAS